MKIVAVLLSVWLLLKSFAYSELKECLDEPIATNRREEIVRWIFRIDLIVAVVWAVYFVTKGVS